MKKKVFWIALGGIAGFAYYYFVGCYNGACLIQSNPYLSTLYGLAMGWAVSTVTVPDAKNKKDNDSQTAH